MPAKEPDALRLLQVMGRFVVMSRYIRASFAIPLPQRQAPAKVRFLSIEPLLADLGPMNLKGISWVIVGGESGPGARPMEAAWVRSVRAQCRTEKVAFFFKQWHHVVAETTSAGQSC